MAPSGPASTPPAPPTTPVRTQDEETARRERLNAIEARRRERNKPSLLEETPRVTDNRNLEDDDQHLNFVDPLPDPTDPNRKETQEPVNSKRQIKNIFEHHRKLEEEQRQKAKAKINAARKPSNVTPPTLPKPPVDKIEPSDLIDLIGEVLDSLYEDATAWHFEERDKLNNPLPKNRKEAIEKGFVHVSFPRDMLHQNDKGKREEKMVHPDGREVVFDGGTGEMVTDPDLVGTYNYVNDVPFPDFSSPKSTHYPGVAGTEHLVDLTEYVSRAVLHFFADMLPHYIGGNKRGKD